MRKTKINAFDIASVALMTAVITVCSYVAIPIGSVPVTLQTFAVFCAAGLLGMKKGILSVFLYLALGAVGLPVFSGFQGGIGVLAGPTGGYVTGFVLLTAVSGLIIHKFGRKTVVLIVAFVAGLAVCYLSGTLWFVYVYSEAFADFGTAVTACVLPYIVPDTVKLILASAVTKAVSERIKI